MRRIKNRLRPPEKPNPIEVYFNTITKYHYFIFSVLFISKIPLMWHILSLIFLSPPMDFVCSTEELKNTNDTLNFCPCERPVWDTSVFSRTFQTKFDTHCDNSWLVSFSQCKFFVGVIIGSFLFGILSDYFGRLSMFAIASVATSLFGCLVIAMPTVESYIFTRIFEGIGVGGCIVTCFVLCIEYCSVRQREIVTALFHIPINIGHVSLAGISYMLRDCDDLQLAVSVPMMVFALSPYILLESPKWLMDRGNVERAIVVMEKFCKFNKQDSGNVRQELEEYWKSRPKRFIRLNFCRIFRRKKLTKNIACMAFIYFVCGMGYYGVSQFIGRMSGNMHFNVALSGSLLFPGTLASIFLLKLLSRRSFLITTNYLSGTLMIFVICIPPEHTILRVFLACFCNACFFLSFLIAFLFSVELFPTSVRSTVLGFLSVLSRSGQILGPLVNSLDEIPAGTIFGILAMFGGVLCYPLPETKNTELPSFYTDSKSITKKIVETAKANDGENEAATSSDTTT